MSFSDAFFISTLFSDLWNEKLFNFFIKCLHILNLTVHSFHRNFFSVLSYHSTSSAKPGGDLCLKNKHMNSWETWMHSECCSRGDNCCFYINPYFNSKKKKKNYIYINLKIYLLPAHHHHFIHLLTGQFGPIQAMSLANHCYHFIVGAFFKGHFSFCIYFPH